MSKSKETQRFEDDLRYVMSSAQGRRVMWTLLFDPYFADVLGQAYSTHSNDTAFNEGRRAVGRRLNSVLQDVSPREYTEMTLDRLKEIQADKAKQERQRNG